MQNKVRQRNMDWAQLLHHSTWHISSIIVPILLLLLISSIIAPLLLLLGTESLPADWASGLPVKKLDDLLSNVKSEVAKLKQK